MQPDNSGLLKCAIFIKIYSSRHVFIWNIWPVKSGFIPFGSAATWANEVL